MAVPAEEERDGRVHPRIRVLDRVRVGLAGATGHDQLAELRGRERRVVDVEAARVELVKAVIDRYAGSRLGAEVGASV